MQPPPSDPKSLKSPKKGPEAKAQPKKLPRPFERYTLLKQIARGGMGEVFLATAGGIEGAERPCVVKIIRREHEEDKSFLARFLDEARIQAQLHHPGVAQVIEATNDRDGKPYVVLEHVEGRNLGELRNRTVQLGARIDWADAIAVGVALGEALAHVHERTDAAGRPLEIVHRDLSPQNVMVGYAGDVKLIDFGTARGQNRRCQTVAGIVFAKPGYVAPEVANNTPGGAPADLYAFGIMLWELMAGRRFLSGDTAEHLAAVGAGERNPTPIAQECDAPRDIDDIIAKLTATKIEDRYASARDATADLVDLLKRAPSLADGERSVRGRIAHLMQRMYPAEPARTRAEFARLVAAARQRAPSASALAPSPSPGPAGSDPALLPGTRYRVVREIGKGGMGVVYEAFHVDLRRTVALKVLPKEHAEHGARFRAEARAIARLVHDNLVQLHDFGISADGRPYYAMELLEGESLDRYIEREKGMDWREAVVFGVQACKALEAAHNAGVVHRDIKPGNLFITKDGVLKLLDFGVAKAKKDIEPGDSHSGALAVVGTPEYMAPEQAAGGTADERSDVYALAAVLYELVTGRLPHVAGTTVALLDSKLKNDPERPRDRAPKRGIPRLVDRAIMRGLDRDPTRRFESAAELKRALETAAREPERIRRRRRALGFAALGAIMLSVGALVGVGVTQPDVRQRAVAYAQPLFERVGGSQAEAEPAAPEAVAEPVAQPAQPTQVAEAPSSPEPTVAASEAQEQPAAELPEAELAPHQGEPEAEQADTSADEAEQQDEVSQALAAAEAVRQKGREIKAFNEFRRIGLEHYDDPRALRAWSEAAVRTKAWGEAIKVARRWVEVDPSADARLHLARMQRALGYSSESVSTLSDLVRDQPGNMEAAQLLAEYRGGKEAVALNE